MPANAHWASEICPAYPVSTTIERIMMALASEVNVARAHTSSITPNSSATVIADARSTARMLIWPVPSLGRRAATWERRGRPRPPATTTRKITRNAGMRLSPVMRSWLRKSVTSPP